MKASKKLRCITNSSLAREKHSFCFILFNLHLARGYGVPPKTQFYRAERRGELFLKNLAKKITNLLPYLIHSQHVQNSSRQRKMYKKISIKINLSKRRDFIENIRLLLRQRNCRRTKSLITFFHFCYKGNFFLLVSFFDRSNGIFQTSMRRMWKLMGRPIDEHIFKI